MAYDARIFGSLVVLIGIAGCGGTPRRPPGWQPVSAVQTLRVDPVVAPEPSGEEGPLELTTAVTTSGDELVAFIERATSPERLSAEARASLLGPTPKRDDRVTETKVRTGAWTCFARRTSKDARAMVLRTSKQGFVVAPIAWLAEIVELPGASEDDIRAWYLAMSRRLATTGRATGLARFGNGNAMAITFELRDVDATDTEIAAERRFMKAGEYDASAWGPVVSGVQSVKTRTMNQHRGVSVFDLLRKLPGAGDRAPSTPI